MNEEDEIKHIAIDENDKEYQKIKKAMSYACTCDPCYYFEYWDYPKMKVDR